MYEDDSWSVLSTTERWISQTLSGANNPYARKEVSYLCENQDSTALNIAGVFRLLKEARETGEAHETRELQRQQDSPSNYQPSTLRQTQVMVIPNNDEFDDFVVFDGLVNTLNQARRNVRDMGITHSVTISINCAHLHPQFGQPSPEQVLQDLQKEENAAEIDVNYEHYKKTKMAARQSPYPSVVVEVRASPSPDFESATTTSAVSSDDIAKLEALLTKSAAKTTKEDFWDQIDLPTVAAQSVMEQCEAYMGQRVSKAAFTESQTTHADEAFEFVFTNIAMMMDGETNILPSIMVLPEFLPHSATSFDVFATQISKMCECIPSLNGLQVETYHPEHVDKARRSPAPILHLVM